MDIQEWLKTTDRKEIEGMEIGQTYYSKNGKEKITLVELSFDNLFWFVNTEYLYCFEFEDGKKSFRWGETMMGNLGHKGDSTKTIQEIKINYVKYLYGENIRDINRLQLVKNCL